MVGPKGEGHRTVAPPLNMPLLTETTLQQLTGTLLFKDYLAVLKNTASSIN